MLKKMPDPNGDEDENDIICQRHKSSRVNRRHGMNGFQTFDNGTPARTMSLSSPPRIVRNAKSNFLTMVQLQCNENYQQHKRLHPRVIALFFVTAVIILIGVHLYLYLCVISSVKEFPTNRPPRQGRYFVRHTGGRSEELIGNHFHRALTPLRDIDQEYYTVRINSWKRPEQLAVSVEHHGSCAGVKQIQIIWCDQYSEPPDTVSNHSKVVLERHSVNSLNERFHILSLQTTPTIGILSIDDDVLRPCEAIDQGFWIWTQNPERMVGFDARSHMINPDGSWTYAYQKATRDSNRYSLALTRYCFIHRDYLQWYMTDLPRPIFGMVESSFNCEDVAMSMFISSLTDGKPPLLADSWAITSMIKLYSEKRISAQKNHKSLRDECVNSFAEQLQLKEGSNRPLTSKTLYPKSNNIFDCGDQDKRVQTFPNVERLVELAQTMERWKKQDVKTTLEELLTLKVVAGGKAYKLGLVEKTDRWEHRWKSNMNPMGIVR